MNLRSSGTHHFRSLIPVDPSRVWTALTDGQETGRYLHGLAAESSWCRDAPIQFRVAGIQPECPSVLVGRVLCAQPSRRLSYLLRSVTQDPST